MDCSCTKLRGLLTGRKPEPLVFLENRVLEH